MYGQTTTGTEEAESYSRNLAENSGEHPEESTGVFFPSRRIKRAFRISDLKTQLLPGTQIPPPHTTAAAVTE